MIGTLMFYFGEKMINDTFGYQLNFYTFGLLVIFLIPMCSNILPDDEFIRIKTEEYN
jgi:hypothetical protein